MKDTTAIPWHRRKGPCKRMDVGIPKENNLMTASGHQEASADPQRQKEQCLALRKPSVLSGAWDETEKSTQGAGVRTRMLDKVVHPDEHRL